MTMFELTLRGFNGAVDSTDQMILWVLADMTEVQIKDYLSKEGLYISGGLVIEVVALPDVFTSDNADFVLPIQFTELKARASKLVLDNEHPMDTITDLRQVSVDNHGEDTL